MLNFKKNSLGTPLKVNSFVTCYQMDYKIKKSHELYLKPHLKICIP